MEEDSPVASTVQVATANSPIELISATGNYRRQRRTQPTNIFHPARTGRIKPGDNWVITSMGSLLLTRHKRPGNRNIQQSKEEFKPKKKKNY